MKLLPSAIPVNRRGCFKKGKILKITAFQQFKVFHRLMLFENFFFLNLIVNLFLVPISCVVANLLSYLCLNPTYLFVFLFSILSLDGQVHGLQCFSILLFILASLKCYFYLLIN